MPINYDNYPANWKTEIRPAIIAREGNKCKFCNVPNGKAILRGHYSGIEVYQDDDGNIYNAANSDVLGSAYVGDVCNDPYKQAIVVVLTIAHLDHDVSNNDHSNLAALCQRCHNRHDKEHRGASRVKNKETKTNQTNLFD